MADKRNFEISIPNLEALLSAFTKAPEISGPILQRAIVATNIVFIQRTDEKTVPYKTTNLIHSFRFSAQPLKATWGPTVNYAAYVELGTHPHQILPVEKKALWWKGAPHPIRMVNHPGTKANPFMEKILQKSEPGITDLFEQALDKVTQAIADAANR